MNYFALVTGFLLSIVTAWISFKDKKADFRAGKNSSESYRQVFAIALLGALITLITNVISNIDNAQNGRQAKKLNDSLLLMNSKIIQLQNQNLNLLIDQQSLAKKIVGSQDDLLGLNRELTKANQKLIILQGSVIDNVIGPGNIPNFIISGLYADKYYYTLQFGVLNKGNSPLRGLRANITDIYSGSYYNPEKQKYEVIENTDSLILFERVSNLEKKVSIGDIPKNSSASFYNARLPKLSGDIGYHVVVMWDNGRISFDFSARIDQKKNHIGMKLTEIVDANGQKLSEKLVRFNEFNF